MIKTSTTAKRIIAMVMTIALAFSLAVSALAVGDNPAATPDENGNFTITIVPGDNTATPTGGLENNQTVKERFKAYAIFTGDLNETPVTDPELPGYNPGVAPNNPPQANQLSNIKWGSGIKGVGDDPVDYTTVKALLKALMKEGTTLTALGLTDFASLKNAYDTTTEPETANGGIEDFEVSGDTTLGKMFQQALVLGEYAEEDNGTVALIDEITDDQLAATASVIAKVITDINGLGNNALLAKAFAAVVKGHLATNPTATSTWDGEKKAWELEVGKAGYYLIIDSYTDADDKGSDVMLAVFGNQTIKAKSKNVTSDKNIVSGDDLVKGDTVSIGDTVTFELKGTLPDNFENFATYKYTFHDKMGEGLTLDTDSIKVEVWMPDASGKYSRIEIKNSVSSTSGDITNYEIKTPGGETGCTFEIVFPDLKKLAYDNANGAVIPLDYTCEIYVTYEATVNDKAVVVNPDGTNVPTDGNTNTSHVEYPLIEGGTGETTKDTVYVYTFGVDLDKTNGVTGTALEGAGFALTTEMPLEDGEALYVIENEEGETASISADELKAYFTDNKLPDKWTENNKQLTGDGDYNGWTVELAPKHTLEEGEPKVTTYYKITDYLGNYDWIAKEALLEALDESVFEDEEKPSSIERVDWKIDGVDKLTGDYVGWYVVLEKNTASDGVTTVDPKKKNVSETTYKVEKDESEPKYITESELLTELGIESIADFDPNNATLSGGEYDGYTVKFETSYEPVTTPELGTFYALFTKSESKAGNPEVTTTTYTIAAWVDEATVDALMADTDNTWTKEYSKDDFEDVDGLEEDVEYYLAVVTVNTDDNKDLLIKGIDEGTYTLTEVVTPGGFDTMDPVTFTLTATIEGPDEDHTDTIPEGALTNLEVETEERDDVVVNGTEADGVITITKGSIELELANMPNGYLPGTGGMGTALFYIGGALMLALAVMLLLILNRKPARK